MRALRLGGSFPSLARFPSLAIALFDFQQEHLALLVSQPPFALSEEFLYLAIT